LGDWDIGGMDGTRWVFGRNADGTVLQVLAVDLLNPSPAAEARKHKLKVTPTSILISRPFRG
jgi:hypothetical protein